MKIRGKIFLIVFVAMVSQSFPASESEWRFYAEGPLSEWKQGFPIGNGRLGAQVWGTGETIRLTLDRGDVWDLRYQRNNREDYSYSRLRELVEKRDHKAIQSEMTPDIGPLNDTTPTRISIGRLSLQLPENTQMNWTTLDMKQGEVYSELNCDQEEVGLRVLAASEPSMILVSVFRTGSWQPSILMEPLADINPELSEKLGYPQPERGSNQRFSWAIQELPESGRVATVWTVLSRPREWHLFLTVIFFVTFHLFSEHRESKHEM